VSQRPTPEGEPYRNKTKRNNGRETAEDYCAGGIASRRHAELLITSGQVRVNGHVVRELGTKADAAKDRIEAAGESSRRKRGGALHYFEQAAGSGVGDGGPGRAKDAAELFARIAGESVSGGESGVCGFGAGVFDE